MFALKTTLSFFLCIGIFNVTNAPIPSYSSWAITTNSTVYIHKDYIPTDIDNIKSHFSNTLLKFQISPDRNTFTTIKKTEYTLTAKIQNALEKGKLTVYANPELTMPYPKGYFDTYTLQDTNILYDPTTFEQKMKFVKSSFMNRFSVDKYQIHQTIYYDDETQNFKTIPTAIAPTMGNHFPWFWIPVNSEFSLDDPNITWAKRMSYPTSLEKGEIIREKNELPKIWEKLIKHVKKNKNDIELYYKTYQLKPFNIENMGNSIDTTIVYDPQTFEADTIIRKHQLVYENIKHLQLIQDWAWDEKNSTMAIRSVGFRPMSSDGKGTKKKPAHAYYLFTKYE